MKKVNIITTTLCVSFSICGFATNAGMPGGETVATQTQVPEIQFDQNDEIPEQLPHTMSQRSSLKRMRRQKSERSFAKEIAISVSAKRTCEQAVAEILERKNGIIDLSNTTDFAMNGDAAMARCCSEIAKTRSYGTGSTNVYVSLANTGISKDMLCKWLDVFRKSKKIMIWNMSGNASVGDWIVDYLDLTRTCALNLANTAVTGATVDRLIAHINANGLGNLRHVNLNHTWVTIADVKQLRQAIQAAAVKWKQDPKNKDAGLDLIGELGVTYSGGRTADAAAPVAPAASAVTGAPVMPAATVVSESQAVSQATAEASIGTHESQTAAPAQPVTVLAMPEAPEPNVQQSQEMLTGQMISDADAIKEAATEVPSPGIAQPGVEPVAGEVTEVGTHVIAPDALETSEQMLVEAQETQQISASQNAPKEAMFVE